MAARPLDCLQLGYKQAYNLISQFTSSRSSVRDKSLLPSTLISRPGTSPTSTEAAHPIELLARRELEREACAGIRRNRERLRAIGVIDTVDEGAIEQLVARFFQAVETKRQVLGPGEKIEHTPEGRELVRLLAFAGNIAPIALADWTIDRRREAEERLSLRSFKDLEGVMAAKYRDPTGKEKAVHFHKGPGNCVLMEDLRKAPTAKDYVQAGMGDKLYYSIAKLLYKFVRPERQDSLRVKRFIELISIALQRALAKRWYTVKGNVIQNWEPRVPFFDVNLIFELLGHPSELLDELRGERRTAKAHYLAAAEFEAERKTSLAEDVRQMFLRFEGAPNAARVDSLLSLKEEEIGRRLFGLRTIRKRANLRLRQAEEERAGIDLLKDEIEALPLDRQRGRLEGEHARKIHEAIRTIETLAEFPTFPVLRRLCQKLKKHLKHEPARERTPALLLASIERARSAASERTIVAQFAEELGALTQEPQTGIEDERSLLDAFRRAQPKIAELEEELRTLKERRPSKTPEFLQRREDQVRKQQGIVEAYDGKSDLPKALVGIAKAHGITIASREEWPEKRPALIAALEAQLAAIHTEKGRTIVSGGLDDTARERLLEKLFGPGKFSSQEFLKEIFTDEFVGALEHSEFYQHPHYAPGATYPDTDTPVLDLNRHPEVYLKNYIPGWFTEMPQKLAGQQVLIMSAERSDSHERNDDFEKDIRGNLGLLAPGGILLTDGLKQSYTRIHRLEEVQRALKGRESEFKAEVVMNAAGKTTGLLIQRAHPKGYLTPEEKAQCFQEGTSFKSLKAVRTHPRIAVLNPLRRRILEVAEEEVEVFRMEIRRLLRTERPLPSDSAREGDFEKFHDAVNARLDELLLEWGLKRLQEHYAVESREALQAVMQIEDAKDFDQAVLDYVDRSHYEGNGLISRADIVTIRERLAADLVVPLEKSGRVRRLFTPRGLEFLEAGRIYGFPRLGEEESPLNRERTHKVRDAEFDNTHFLRASGELEARTASVRYQLAYLRRRLGRKLILIIDFADCSTNDLLREALARLLGPECYTPNVEVLKIDFRPGQMIKDLQDVQRRIASFVGRGGIVIGGGSWFDAYDDYGKTYKREVTHPLLDAIQERNSLVRLIQICFSYQAISDAIGKRFCHDNDGQSLIDTTPGMLEIGYVPIEVERDARNHPLIMSCPDRFTVAFTHSGHVDDRRGDEKGEKTKHFLRPLARSVLTGLPIMSAGFDDRLFAMQFHPELYGPEGVNRIMNELDGNYKEGIARAFGISTEHIRHNFRKTPRVNAGDFILVNALHHHTHNIRA